MILNNLIAGSRTFESWVRKAGPQRCGAGRELDFQPLERSRAAPERSGAQKFYITFIHY